VPTTSPAANEEETLPQHNIRTSLQVINRSYPLPITSLSEPALTNHNNDDKTRTSSLESLPKRDIVSNPSYREQVATVQVLEAGVLFHSGIIGLNLDTSSSTQLKSLFIVLVFHQAFEGILLSILSNLQEIQMTSYPQIPHNNTMKKCEIEKILTGSSDTQVSASAPASQPSTFPPGRHERNGLSAPSTAS
jgi:hypothetical protein